MESTLLNEHESACRAAHEQAQLLQHLYQRLGDDGYDIDSGRRVSELREDRLLLVGKLKTLGLLRTEPDPERESLLGFATDLKRVFGGTQGDAAKERLLREEREFLRLCEQLGGHDDDERIVQTIDRTRAAIEQLGT